MTPERERGLSDAAKNAAMFDKCRDLLEQIKKQEFFGEMTIRIKKGEIYQVNVTQSFRVDGLTSQLMK